MDAERAICPSPTPEWQDKFDTAMLLGNGHTRSKEIANDSTITLEGLIGLLKQDLNKRAEMSPTTNMDPTGPTKPPEIKRPKCHSRIQDDGSLPKPKRLTF